MEGRVEQSLLLSRPAPWGRFLLFSVGAHVAAVAALVAVQAWTGRPSIDLDQKPIQASLVRLGKTRDPKALPRLEPEPPPPAEEAKPAPTPAEPPPPPAPVPGLKPAPVAPTPPKTGAEAAAQRKKLFGAFSKFAKASKPEELEGQLDGDPNGDSAKQEGERYYGLLSVQVHRHYDVAQTIPEDERLHLRAQVAIRISRAGEVTKTTLAKSSGNPLFDNAVLAALQRASPFPPPPDALRDRLAREGVVLEFKP